MKRFIVAGIGTEVGKTVASAILTKVLKASYWKPIQCGEELHSDAALMRQLIDANRYKIYPPAISLQAPLSPHHAARLENISIDGASIIPPVTDRPLIIEGVGGILVPLSINFSAFDLFKTWESKWIIVSRHYLGSINHTLLTLEFLKRENISVAGLIFNGTPNPDSEAAILTQSQVPMLARLLPETAINSLIIQKYARKWKNCLKILSP